MKREDGTSLPSSQWNLVDKVGSDTYPQESLSKLQPTRSVSCVSGRFGERVDGVLAMVGCVDAAVTVVDRVANVLTVVDRGVVPEVVDEGAVSDGAGVGIVDNWAR